MARKCKYVIVYDKRNDKLLFECGYVFFHRDLIPNYGSKYMEYDIYGGGDFYIDNNRKQIIFSGYSSEFGRPSKDEFSKAFDTKKEHILDDLSFINDCLNNLGEVDLNDYEIINKL